MKKPYISTANSTALIALLSVAPCALAANVDQSQLNANIALTFNAINLSIGQSFQAGKSGALTDIDVFSNGQVAGENNTLVLDLYSGSGIGGQLLGSLTTSVLSVRNSTLSGWLIDINTQSLNTQVVAGHEYTFSISQVTGTGAGDLADTGLLSSALNPYSNGQAFSTSLGGLSNWDLEFQTLVSTAAPISTPIPTTFWLSAGGFIGITCMTRKHKTA